MKLDPRRLLDLLAIARHGSFSAAAEATGVSQPALSQSIAMLERGLGVRVLDRDRHGARLNEFGETLVFQAQSLESLLAKANDEIRLRSLGIEGPLAVGVTPITTVGMVPQALERLLRETSNISVSIVEGLDEKIVSMLRLRELDMVVSRLGPRLDFSDIVEEPLMLSDWALIACPEHPLAKRSSLSLKELGDVQWVLPAHGSTFRRQLEVVFTNAGHRWPTRGISTNSILAIKTIVMTTKCVTIMSPRLVEVEVQAGRLCSVPVDDIGSLQPIGLILRRADELSPTAARFARLLREVAIESTAS
jgi:DNA-binding transcriptional LysR family regulator